MKRWIPITIEGQSVHLPVYGVSEHSIGEGGRRQLRSMVWNRLTSPGPIDVPGGWIIALDKVLELNADL